MAAENIMLAVCMVGHCNVAFSRHSLHACVMNGVGHFNLHPHALTSVSYDACVYLVLSLCRVLRLLAYAYTTYY
ncbi:hypothetical protein BDV24DRAFT_34073 [Aspergillus arachidicola]|uniref:Uncharacterized protein n=1 Tax=Aspergillus arachidicola TaxID=656916 RepID=A0A5N6YEH8_9EURO|nr:hypothetical protein BDV24DRAFT_34073 [Aspergillus arachidicola]